MSEERLSLIPRATQANTSANMSGRMVMVESDEELRGLAADGDMDPEILDLDWNTVRIATPGHEDDDHDDGEGGTSSSGPAYKKAVEPFGPWGSCVLGTMYVLFGTSAGLVAKGTVHDHHYAYSVESAVFMQDFVKLVVTMILLGRDYCKHRDRIAPVTCSIILWYCIPGLLYFFTNTLGFVVYETLVPAQVGVLMQVKIIFAALISRISIKTVILPIQWCGIVLLTLGAAFSQTHGLHLAQDAPLRDCLLVIFMAFLSSVAGNTCAYLLRYKTSGSIHQSNALLYAASLIMNATFVVSRPASRQHIQEHGFFGGYTIAVWIVVLLQSCNGLTVSMIFKYVGVVFEVYSGVLAMVWTTIMSIYLFNYHFTWEFGLGMVLISASLFLYVTKPEFLCFRNTPSTAVSYGALDVEDTLDGVTPVAADHGPKNNDDNIEVMLVNG